MKLFVLIKSTISWFFVEYFGIQIFAKEEGVLSSEGDKTGSGRVRD